MENQQLRLFDFILHQAKNYPQEDCLCHKVDGKWKKYSTDAVVNEMNTISRSLLAYGIKPGDKIAIVSQNRPEWNFVDLGILRMGAIDVPVYPTISPADYKYIFNDAEVKIAFVSDLELYNKVNEVKGEIPTLLEIFSFDQLQGVKHWSELKAMDDPNLQDEVERISNSIHPEDLATLIYTSGTTGKPKGVMLSHRNISSNVLGSKPRLPVGSDASSLSFLPLCHIYERMILYLYMYTGVSTYYAESMDTIGENLKEVRPHVFTAVPRLLEKVYDKIMAKGEELTGIKRSLFFWAVDLGRRYEPYGKNGWFYEFQLKIARKLIFSKWQEALGGRAEAVASGSAALNPNLARVFLAAGIPVMEGYGLTETSPVISVNCAENHGTMIGTTGRPLNGVQVKIAEDGEILVKGPNVMMGYYKQPELTAEAIDNEGWFHTGDIGEMVNNEYLKITDRKKEIFKTSGGKYIAPQLMENKFKESRFIEQVMVIGENKKHPSAIIAPNFEIVKEYCNRKNIPYTNPSEIIKNPKILDVIQREVNKLNQEFGKWEQVKKIVLVPDVWSVPSGEITPTLKLKRKFIMEKYHALVEEIYRE